MCLKILVVEDDKDQFNAYKQALDDDGLSDKYVLLHATNIEAAKKHVCNEKINGAILDLKVPPSPDNEANTEKGIKYLKDLLKGEQFPIVVVSANISSLPENDIELPKHLKKFDREAGVHSKVFKHFEEIKDLLQITPIMPKIIEEIQDEFQQSVWDLWKDWGYLNIRFDTKNAEKSKTFLKRYVSNCLFEKWMANDLFNKMHPTEFYTYPLPKENVHTGDILNLDDKYWIVVTAPCDLSNQNFPDNLTLLRCEKICLSLYKGIVKAFEGGDSDERRCKQKRKLRSKFTTPPPNKHYLPPWEKNGNSFNVLFKGIKTVPFSSEDREELKNKRVATLSAHFLPYLLQRYGSYISRIGQAEIAIDEYMDYWIKVISERGIGD